MLSDYFQTLPLPSDQFNGSYDLRLVALSFVVATLASYIALDLTGRLRDLSNTPTSTLLWLVGGSIAMGAGIWSMHFIGMLSFTIPGLELKYDLFWTGLSLLVAILASAFALILLRSPSVRIEHYIAGGIVLGLAIASMHYTGMEGLLIALNIRYLPGLFALSIFIAIIASEAAIWLSLKSNKVILRMRSRIKFISAIIMGTAICGMHYTGMAASIFTPLCAPTPVVAGTGYLDPTLLAIGIAGVTFVVLGIAFFTSSYKESLNQQMLEKSRQLGMAEISASVLHSVGNVLNSVNVSSSTVIEKLSTSRLDGLEKLCTLFNEHKHNLAEFISQDPRGIKALEFLNMLTKYLREEQHTVSDELLRLNKNVDLIMTIISTQQELSKVQHLDQLLSINDLLDEALLITGLNLKEQITVERQYGKINPIKIDKVKMLHILVNLLRNAKDAVIESPKQNKKIIIKTSLLNKDKLRIEISDNGVGILPKNKVRIFNYGFTTKTSGHGFGLHTSALTVNELGGEIHVSSKGVEKGAAFIMDFPSIY